MSARTIRLMADTRLSDSARIIGFWLMQEEPGEDGFVEARFDFIRSMLHGFPSDDVIRKHLRMLRGSGWAERKPGGFGKGDRYRVLDPLKTTRPASEPSLLDPDLSIPYPTRPGSEPTLSPTRPASEPSLSAQRGGTIGGGGGEEVDGGNPPIVPPSGVDPSAAALIEKESDRLAGCRSALRQYLERFVSPKDQVLYVGTVLGLLNEIGEYHWKRHQGGSVSVSERPAMIALAINGLGDKAEKSMAGPVGSTRNLETKLSWVVNPSTSGRRKPTVPMSTGEAKAATSTEDPYAGFERGTTDAA